MKILILLFVTFSVFAKNYEYQNLDFSINSTNPNDIHFSFKLIQKTDLNKYPKIFSSLYNNGMTGVQGTSLVLVKSVFVVNKPSSYFTRDLLLDEKYNLKVTGVARVEKKSENSIFFYNPGLMGYNYEMTLHLESFDSQVKDLSMVSLVDNFKMLDDKLGTWDTTAVRLGRKFSGKGFGSVALTNHLAQNQQTVMVTYSIVSLMPLFAWPEMVKSNVLIEIENLRNRNNLYSK